METQYFKDYSPALGREMECKVYGHAGRPMLFIPCQDGRFFDFEDFHMAGTLAPWIESGQIMVISIATIDQKTWSDTNGDPYWRIRRYEQWIRYIVEEVVPKIQYIAKERNGWDKHVFLPLMLIWYIRSEYNEAKQCIQHRSSYIILQGYEPLQEFGICGRTRYSHLYWDYILQK